METRNFDPELITAKPSYAKKIDENIDNYCSWYKVLYVNTALKKVIKNSKTYFSEKPTPGTNKASQSKDFIIHGGYIIIGITFICYYFAIFIYNYTSFNCFRNMSQVEVTFKVKWKNKCLQNAVNSVHMKITKTYEIVGLAIRRVMFFISFQTDQLSRPMKLSNRRNARTRTEGVFNFKRNPFKAS